MNDIEKEIEATCLLVDDFAKQKLTPGTPLYELQQGMIANVKRYRMEKGEKQ
jgi:hypothetical protein